MGQRLALGREDRRRILAAWRHPHDDLFHFSSQTGIPAGYAPAGASRATPGSKAAILTKSKDGEAHHGRSR
jgi:hypothetical protein